MEKTYKQVPAGTVAFKALLREFPKLKRAGIDFVCGDEQIVLASAITAEQAFWLYNEPAMRVEALAEMPAAPAAPVAAPPPPPPPPGAPGKPNGKDGK